MDMLITSAVILVSGLMSIGAFLASEWAKEGF